jgi:hypothetical protein
MTNRRRTSAVVALVACLLVGRVAAACFPFLHDCPPLALSAGVGAKATRATLTVASWVIGGAVAVGCVATLFVPCLVIPAMLRDEHGAVATAPASAPAGSGAPGVVVTLDELAERAPASSPPPGSSVLNPLVTIGPDGVETYVAPRWPVYPATGSSAFGAPGSFTNPYVVETHPPRRAPVAAPITLRPLPVFDARHPYGYVPAEPLTVMPAYPLGVPALP